MLHSLISFCYTLQFKQIVREIRSLFFVIIYIVLSISGVGQTTVTFLLSSTWTCPADVSSVTVQCWGGGGAGGGASGLNSSNTRSTGGGGGGGSYAQKTISVTANTQYTITVGEGGIASSVKPGDRTYSQSGGESNFSYGIKLVKAVGGSGGQNMVGGADDPDQHKGLGGAGGLTSGNVATTSHAGGNGKTSPDATGASGYGGGGGSSAGSDGPGTSATSRIGAVANANGGGGNGGNGGESITTTPTNFIAASSALQNSGGGGGGSHANLDQAWKIGGNGGSGKVILTYNSSTLPVNLIYFTSYKIKSGILLEWSTASEENNIGFVVEKSLNGIEFKEIGFVKSLSESGNSYNILKYSFIDKLPAEIKNLYRLKQIDKDEKFNYSNITVQLFDDPVAPSVSLLHPNPGEGRLNLVISNPINESICVKLRDIYGKIVQSKLYELFEGDNQIFFDASHQKNGFYIINIENMNSKIIKSMRYIKL